MKQCRVYRVRTIGYTVRYNHWGPKPHTRRLIPYPIDLCQIGNTIMIIFVNTYVEGGKRLSIVIHSFIAPHSLVYNTYKYFSNKLFIHFILLHSYTVPAFLQPGPKTSRIKTKYQDQSLRLKIKIKVKVKDQSKHTDQGQRLKTSQVLGLGSGLGLA